MNTLTAPEARKLTDLEGIIEEGLQTFVEVGAALSLIREQKLYRATHGTFEDYCRERWGWSRQRAAQLIGASDVVVSLSTIVDSPPTNEAQARELVAVPEEQRAQVWEEAVVQTNGKPTAKAVRAAAVRNGRAPVRRGPAVQDLEEKVRKLMASDTYIEAVVGMGRATYKRAREIIMLAEDDGLLPADREIAQSALAQMRETGQVAAWESVREIAARRLGSLRGHGDPSKASADQLVAFERAAGIVVSACANIPRVTVPYLVADVAAEWEHQISGALDQLKSLQREVRRYIR